MARLPETALSPVGPPSLSRAIPTLADVIVVLILQFGAPGAAHNI
jgi:hypothetical protein